MGKIDRTIMNTKVSAGIKNDDLHKRLLGHKSLKSTLRYTQLIALPQNEEYICKVAENVEEAKQLIEDGFEYVCDMDAVKLFRKRK